MSPVTLAGLEAVAGSMLLKSLKRVHFLLNGTPLHSSSYLRRYIFSSNNSGIKTLALQRSLDVPYANFVPMKYPGGQG